MVAGWFGREKPKMGSGIGTKRRGNNLRDGQKLHCLILQSELSENVIHFDSFSVPRETASPVKIRNDSVGCCEQ